MNHVFLTILGHFFDLLEPLLVGFGSVLHLGNVSSVVEQKVIVDITQLFKSLYILQPLKRTKKNFRGEIK